jgi:ATPase subunit of ABC transporter with duplicated ATPase domains
LAQELPLDQTALDYVSEVARRTDPGLTLEKVRAALGALGLTGSLPLQQIGSLSGGEKARVALAVFALVPANVLLLDEASNHLDAATLEVLTGTSIGTHVQGFKG